MLQLLLQLLMSLALLLLLQLDLRKEQLLLRPLHRRRCVAEQQFGQLAVIGLGSGAASARYEVPYWP